MCWYNLVMGLMAFLDSSQLYLFVGACLALVAIPGPAVAFIVTRSVSEGTVLGVKTAAGIALGNLCQALAAAFGLAAILASYPSVYQLIKYIGAGYLIYLGIRAFLAKEKSPTTKGLDRMGAAFRQGALVGLLNPKVSLFLLAFLPQFTDPTSDPLWEQLLTLGVGFVFIGWAGDTFWALCAGLASTRLRNKGGTAWGRYASGLVYCVLGIATAFWWN